jgi:hypothetical protein
VHLLAGQAEVGDGRDVSDRNIPLSLPAMALNLASLLRGVVLIREPALGLRLDLRGIGLGMVKIPRASWCYLARSSAIF